MTEGVVVKLTATVLVRSEPGLPHSAAMPAVNATGCPRAGAKEGPRRSLLDARRALP